MNALNIREILVSTQIMFPQSLFTRNLYYSYIMPWLVDPLRSGVPFYRPDCIRLFPEFIRMAPRGSEPYLLVELHW